MFINQLLLYASSPSTVVSSTLPQAMLRSRQRQLCPLPSTRLGPQSLPSLNSLLPLCCSGACSATFLSDAHPHSHQVMIDRVHPSSWDCLHFKIPCLERATFNLKEWNFQLCNFRSCSGGMSVVFQSKGSRGSPHIVLRSCSLQLLELWALVTLLSSPN